MQSLTGVDIFNTGNQSGFQSAAFEIFFHQYKNNPIYKTFCDYLSINPGNLKDITEIPFIPVEFFRNHTVISGEVRVETIFESSGTAGVTPGKHYVKDRSLYDNSFLNGFRMFYGEPSEYVITALLPSYLDRAGSSLVYMVDRLITMTGSELSGFYRNNTAGLIEAIHKARGLEKKILLIGVSYALLDLAEQFSPDLSGVIVMETGGMKGRRKEVTRQELHETLQRKFNISSVHSEYGMTELLSQAYSSGKGIFYSPPWMKVLIRDPQDPLSIIAEPDRIGGINIIDLANMNSCSFISTGDLGKIHEDGGFEVLGRFDNSDIRGCNLMAE